MKRILLILIAFAIAIPVTASEYHVAKSGTDENKGTLESPLRTIQMAPSLWQLRNL